MGGGGRRTRISYNRSPEARRNRETSMIVFVSRWLVPVLTPPVGSGAVALPRGGLRAPGRRKDVMRAAGDGAEVRDLGDVVLMPGLVNAHTHLELSFLAES